MQPEPDASKATHLRPAVAAIVTDGDGRLLLQRRSDNGITLFTCRILGGTLQTCAESLDLQFFDPARLPEDMLTMHRMLVQDAVAGGPAGFIR